MHIRRATPDDLPALLSLINKAYEVETFLEGPRTSGEELRELLERGLFLAALEPRDGAVVEACVYVELRGQRGYFGMLAVKAARQGAGLGQTMVEAAEHHCRSQNCTHMDITVLSRRAELLPFYRRLGYTQTGMKKFETTQRKIDELGCECIEMSKAL